MRVKRPERRQAQWRDASLDQVIPGNHRVRAEWTYVESLDLAPLCATIQAVEGGPGRDAVDPRILLALWMFATIEGVSSEHETAVNSPSLAQRAGEEVIPARQSWNFSSPACSW